MVRPSRSKLASGYKSVGTTVDGIKVLKPKTKPIHFTTAQIRSTISKVLRENAIKAAEKG